MAKRVKDVLGMTDHLKVALTESEQSDWEALGKITSRMWRNFWIEVAHRHGYTNAAIAKEFNISESTVRVILKGGK